MADGGCANALTASHARGARQVGIGLTDIGYVVINNRYKHTRAVPTRLIDAVVVPGVRTV